MHPVFKKYLLASTVLACTLTGYADPPAWWRDVVPPVIIPGAAPNNYGPANIGQAKHMAKSALAALAPVIPPEVAADIEADLVGSGKPIPNWNPPADQAARDKNHAPLLTGQLKAIAHPFYFHLHAAAPAWLAEQRAANGTESGGIFPWTDAPSDDNHHGMASIGQLKAVFSLHFTQDTDGDTLLDLTEHILGTNPDLPQTFTGIPDAWLASYYTTVIGFNSQQDDEEEGLTNFEEYLYGANPLNSDTDGDGVSDYAEVNQGSNPNNASNGGGPPSDPVIDVSFLVGGDYASWRMEILPKGPRDDRAALKLASPNPGETETKTLKLWKNNRYEITLHRTGGEENWYCWEAMVENGPGAITFDDGTGWISDGERNEEGLFFTVAGHWLVDNRQGLLTDHIHSYGMDVASPLKAELVPVAIEDNIQATGVDIVSNGVEADVAGYQDKLWIMAPSGNDQGNNPCSNSMKFKIPVNPSTELDISYPQGQQAPATPTPATVTLGQAAADCAWHGESATTTETPAAEWEIGASGETKTEVELPIAVKTMKRRTVKAAVYLVRRPESRQFPAVDEGLLLNELNKVFAYQLNAWFELKFYSKTISYDTNLDRNLILSSGLTEFPGLLADPQVTAADPAFTPDIKVLLIDDIRFYGVDDPLNPVLSPLAGYTPSGNVCVVKVGTAFTDASGDPQVEDKDPALVRQNVAHEIGHVMLGEDHPDEGGGPAPLISVQPDIRRLMYSGIDGIPNSVKLLVKGEWDETELWLKFGRINGDN